MKHQPIALKAQLIQECGTLGIGVDDDEAESLLEYLDWLLEANKIHNLTAIRTVEEGVSLHLVDSLAATPEVEACPSGPIIDLGTGGGLPGVPLCVHTGRSVDLLDSTRKKAEALRSYVEGCGMNARVFASRAEEHAISHAGLYAGVVARAVASLPSLVELAAPLLREGGYLVCLKGAPEPSEVTRGQAAARICGLRDCSTRTFTLPAGSQQRTVIAYQRVAEPLRMLPRAIGRAQKNPLA